MELMLIVYLVGLIAQLPALLFIFASIVFMMAFVGCIWAYDTHVKTEEKRAYFKKRLFYPKIFVLLLFLMWLTPNEQTMKYMAGAYLIQSTYESNIVQKGLPLMEKTVLNTLESWAEDAPELKVLLEKTEVVKQDLEN